MPFRGMHRYFLDQYSKLNLWAIDQHGYCAVVYLDADMLVLRNFDELFRFPLPFAAAPGMWTGRPRLAHTVEFSASVMPLR